ncbi:hypothetical protein KAR91_19500 [Candidatus Pacearchaeota archaeon]|nr:hypothetical protein [Candidatus Pacearchaeota archaeon]
MRICKDCHGNGETRTGRSRGGMPVYGPAQVSRCYTCGGSGNVEDNRKVTPE